MLHLQLLARLLHSCDFFHIGELTAMYFDYVKLFRRQCDLLFYLVNIVPVGYYYHYSNKKGGCYDSGLAATAMMHF